MIYSSISILVASFTTALNALGPSKPFPAAPFLSGLKATNPAFYNITIGISVLMFWYGGWGLMDTYLPGSQRTKYWIAFLAGLVFLVVTQSWDQF